MNSSLRVNRIFLCVSILLSLSLMATAAPPAPPVNHPSAPAARPSPPAYHPLAPAPSRPSYNPAPAHPSYNPAPTHPSYSPAPAQGGGARPSPSAPVRSYTPGGGTSGQQPSTGSITTYTPHTYTPNSPAATHSIGNPSAGGEGVRSPSGVTTYTPHPSAGTNYTPAAPPATHSNTYTPAAPAATHSNSYTPSAPNARGANSFTPRNSSPGAAAGGGTHPVYNVPATGGAGRPGSDNSTLTPTGSQSVLHQVNGARSGMTGINNRTIPPGQVEVHPDKNLTVNASNGRNFNLRPNGTLASYTVHGQTSTFRGDGRLASVHTPNMNINHGPHGERTIISERPDHSRLVSTGRHSGYIEHPVNFHGRTYNQRTFVHGGRVFTHTYVGYRYHGLLFDEYLPYYYYNPMFYGWAYYPWGTPVFYGWGWAGSPWFGFYAGYFSPWNTYPSGAYWLTDYLLSQTLEAGYQMEAQAGGGEPVATASEDAGSDEAYAPADTPITPEIKQMIAQEVQQQLAYENAAAAKPDQAPTLDGLPQVMVPNHLFVVDQSLSVTTTEGQQCGLSTGDVIKLVAAPPETSTTAELTVTSSRKADCPAGLTVSVPLESLQEMQNNFRSQLDSGLQELHDQQGKGGLPAAPQSAIAPPPRPVDQPPAENENVQGLLDAQQQQADQTESSITQSVFTDPTKPQ